MHNNPGKRGRVSSPDHWPWAIFRFHYLDDSSVPHAGWAGSADFPVVYGP
jgi:hypothetical protein